MSIDEELVTSCVPETFPLHGVPEERVREAVERSQLRFIALSTDVDDDPLTAGTYAIMGLVYLLRGLRQLHLGVCCSAHILVFAATRGKRNTSIR